jgi:hypothetical protein
MIRDSLIRDSKIKNQESGMVITSATSAQARAGGDSSGPASSMWIHDPRFSRRWPHDVS